MADLGSFKSRIGGGVRPNQFRVLIAQNGLAGAGVADDEFSFLCHASSLPGSNMGRAEAWHRGRATYLAGERTFDPWTVTVYSDPEMNLRTFFETWQHAMNDYQTNSAATTNPFEYKTHAIVSQLDRQDAIVKTYRVEHMFPISISEVSLSWQANDQVAEFTVTFSIDSFEPFV